MSNEYRGKSHYCIQAFSKAGCVKTTFSTSQQLITHSHSQPESAINESSRATHY